MSKQHKGGKGQPGIGQDALRDRVLHAALGAGADQLTDVISWHAHVPFAHVLIDLLKPGLTVELGVHQGDSLLSMAAALQRFGQSGRIVGIDTWRGDDHAGTYDGTAVLEGLMARAAAFGPRITLLRSTFDDALQGFADGSVDLLHIDGLHTYEAVRHDFESWKPKLSPRAVVLFHDTAVKTGDFGVYRFWAEVESLGPSFEFPFGNGLGVLLPGGKGPSAVLALLDQLRSDAQLRGELSAIGEAMEARSLRQVLSERVQTLQAEIEAERETAAREMSRLNALIEEERKLGGATISGLEEELESTRGTAGIEIARLSGLLEDERRMVETERQKALTEAEALAGTLENERQETARLNRQLQETESRVQALLEEGRQQAEARQHLDRALAETAALTATLEAERQEAVRLRQQLHETAGRVEALLEEGSQRSEADRQRLQKALADAAALTGALEAERQETARLQQLLQETEGRLQVLQKEAEANRSLAEERSDAALLRAVAAETALAEERDLSRTTIDLLKQKNAKAGRDLGLARASLTREAERAATREARITALADQLAEAEAQLAAARSDSGRQAASIQEAQGEITRLETLIAHERAQAIEEFARLDTLVATDRASGRTEIDRLNREIAILHRDYTARLEQARLKNRGLRLFKKVAMPAFRLLPLPRRTKQRLRLAIVTRYGAALQLVPPKMPALATQTQLALRPLTSRYLDLARASTGTPSNLPPRSVSIIIPVFNQIEYTLRCIEAIKMNTGEIEHEIIVVDDCSTDMTEIMLSPRSDIIYIRNEKNLGFIGSCNAGLKQAGKTYVCYLNNDTEVTPVWLSALVDTFELHPGTGLAGSQLIYPDGRLQEAGGIIWDDFSGWNWGRLQDPEAPRFTYARMADYCSGAAILLPRALANAIGGFDPEFTPAYGEDSDMAFRLRAMGLATVYQPLSRVVHYEGISSGTDTTQGVKAYQVVNAEKLKQRWTHVLPHQGENGVDPDRAVDRGRIGRVLVIDQITPEPDRDAGSITALELMLALRDLGYKVSFIPCSNFTYIPDYTDLLGALGIESVLYPWAKSVEDHLIQAGDSYDAVIIFRVNTATDHLDTIRRLAPRAKIIFHNSDLHFLREERARLVNNPDIAERRLSPETTKSRELAIIAGSDVTIVHSHFERELLGEIVPQVPVVVFPWVYEPRGPGAAPAQRQDVVFLGGYRHYPNVDAVLHYARDVAPVLERRLPEIRFRAIGSNPTEEMMALASDRLVIEGFVDDLGPVLSKARVMLVPLRYGAGLKGKIVTAMAHGLPVVTTSVGAEGMALRHGENVLIADSPEEMAAAVERLCTDETLWRRLSEAGLAFVAATTSREEGYRITRAILGHADLPALPHVSAAAAPVQHVMSAGTPGTLRDPATLADAARQALGLATGAPVTLWLPPGAGTESLLASGKAPAVRLARIGRDEAVGDGPAVLLADAFDDEGLNRILMRLPAGAPVEAIVFVPPTMAVTPSGYGISHMLSGLPLANGSALTPVHLRHTASLSRLGRRLHWQSDRAITGFPGMTILRLA